MLKICHSLPDWRDNVVFGFFFYFILGHCVGLSCQWHQYLISTLAYAAPFILITVAVKVLEEHYLVHTHRHIHIHSHLNQKDH